MIVPSENQHRPDHPPVLRAGQGERHIRALPAKHHQNKIMALRASRFVRNCGARAREAGVKDPSTPNEWIAVANERMPDAKTLFGARQRSVGVVYIVGYAVECALKAYLIAHNIPLPARGREGHNLRALWKASGLRLTDLGDQGGAKAYFLTDWTTDLRYQTIVNSSLSIEDLLNGACSITAWLQTKVKRKPRR